MFEIMANVAKEKRMNHTDFNFKISTNDVNVRKKCAASTIMAPHGNS